MKKLNTFGIDQKAERLIWAHSAEEILNYVRHHGAPALVLGGGSNMLLTQDVTVDVLKVDIHGRKVVFENDDEVGQVFKQISDTIDKIETLND